MKTMNKQPKTKTTDLQSQRNDIPTRLSAARVRVATGAVGLVVCIGVWIYSALANAQQPVLTISNLGSNQFNIVITNAITTTNYTLFGRPFLEDQNYPWKVLGVANVGETNFLVDGAGWDSGFFRVLLGIDSDGDGVPDWQDAAPLDPSIGQLQVIIYSPANGSTISNYPHPP